MKKEIHHELTFTRSYRNHYCVKILLTKVKDVEYILGEEVLRPQPHKGGSVTQILCSDLYPVVLSYNTKMETMVFSVDFQSKVLDGEELVVHKPGNRYQIILQDIDFTGLHMNLIIRKEKEKKKKDKKKGKEEWIDHSNIPLIASESNEIDEVDLLPLRKKKKSMCEFGGHNRNLI